MTPDEAQRIREAAIVNGRRERRKQGIPERIEDEAMTADLASLLSPADADWLRRSCEASGVPSTVTDPIVLSHAADLLRPD